MLFAVLAPLLPTLAGELHLAVSAAGLLGGAYPIGMLIGTIPAGLATRRFNPRITAVVGMWMVAISTAGFAFGGTTLALECARMVQGAGGAAAWAGALTWGLKSSSERASGAFIGGTLGAAFTGTLIAPLVGILAAGGLRREVFLGLGAMLAGIALWGGPADELPGRTDGKVDGLRAMPEPARSASSASARSARNDGRRSLLLMALIGTIEGMLLTLSPLVLASLGVGVGALGLVVLCAYAPQTIVARQVGRLADARGPRLPIARCLSLLVPGLPLVPIVTQPALACVLSSVLLSITLASLPAVFAFASRSATSSYGDQGMAMALVNGAWALGLAGGTIASTSLAGAFGASAAYLPAAAACLLGIAVIL